MIELLDGAMEMIFPDVEGCFDQGAQVTSSTLQCNGELGEMGKRGRKAVGRVGRGCHC